MKKKVSAWSPIICVSLIMIVSVALNYCMVLEMYSGMALDQLIRNANSAIYDSNAKTIVHFLIELLPATVYACAVLWNPKDQDFFRRLANCTIILIGALLSVAVVWFFINLYTELYQLRVSLTFLPGCALVGSIYGLVKSHNLITAINFSRQLLWYLPLLFLTFAAISHSKPQEPWQENL